MKAKTMVVVTTLLMSSGLVLAAGYAQELNADHPGSTGGTNQDAPTTPSGGMPMMPMHAHMQKMRSQMAEIHRTKDPDKRDELIESHMENMQSMMKMMHGMREGQSMMAQGGMMGPGMDMPGGMMMSGQQGDKMATRQGCMMGMRTMGMKNRQQMMEKRMDMMQMMMDQMMQNQAAAEETRKMK
jgi:hypothetical protein